MVRKRITGNDVYLEHRNRNAVLEQAGNKVTIERADLVDVIEALRQIAVAEGLVETDEEFFDKCISKDASDRGAKEQR